MHEVIQSQTELPKLAEKLLAYYRPKLTVLKDHNALTKEKIDQMEAFFDKAEKNLAEFTSPFPAMLPDCGVCGAALPTVTKSDFTFCTCSSKRSQADIYMKYVEQRTEFFTIFLIALGWKVPA